MDRTAEELERIQAIMGAADVPRSPVSPVLQHLTLNTGQISHVERDDFLPDEIDRFVPVIGMQGGAIPGMNGWFVDIMFPLDSAGLRKDGAAHFHFAGQSGLRPVFGFVCWREDVSEVTWKQMRQAYLSFQRPFRKIGLWHAVTSKRLPTPWLASWTVIADQQKAASFARAERALAWALVR